MSVSWVVVEVIQTSAAVPSANAATWSYISVRFCSPS